MSLDDPEETRRCCMCECGICMFPGVYRHCDRCQEEYRRWLSLVMEQRKNENVNSESNV